jgi:hypothetical protein
MSAKLEADASALKNRENAMTPLFMRCSALEKVYSLWGSTGEKSRVCGDPGEDLGETDEDVGSPDDTRIEWQGFQVGVAVFA